MAREDFVEVRIFNQSYRLASEGRDPRYIERAAAYLDERMQAAASEAASRPPFDIAVLAAMEIADKVLEERRKKESLLSEADQRISAFTRRLESRDRAAPEAEQPPPPAPRF